MVVAMKLIQVTAALFAPLFFLPQAVLSEEGENRVLRSTSSSKAPSSKAPKSTKSPKAPDVTTTTTTTSTPDVTTTTTTTSTTFSKTFYPFISGVLDVGLDMETIQSTVAKLDGNLQGRYEEMKGPLLTMDQCHRIRDYTDKRWKADVDAGVDVARGKNYTIDYRIELQPEELASMIGVASVQRLYQAFRDYDEDYPVSRIVVRRTTSVHEHHIQYHNDGPTAVMHLWLNAPTEIEGGGLWYLTSNGTAVVDTSITGAASFHSEGIVHGVATFAGTRYILIFLSDHKGASDVVAPFLAKSLVHSEL